MTSNQIKDDNLRLILAPGHEDFLCARIRERLMANAVIALLWFVVPALAEFLLIIGGRLLGGLSFAGDLANVGLYYCVALLVFSPVPLLVIPRNYWMARKFIGYFEDHLEFLDGYDRETDAGRLRLEGYATAFAILNGSILLIILFIWFMTETIFFRLNAGW